jgi:hypothetical protein
MQDYNILKGDSQISSDRETLNDNFESIASDFSGSAFPTTNLVAGMTCWRTDTNILYKLQSDLTTWTEIGRFTSGKFYAPNATSATAATKATQDASGNTITSTYVKSVTASGSTVTVTKGDGTTSTFTTPNTTYSNMTGASTSAAGKAGLVPAPAAGAVKRYLAADGTFKAFDYNNLDNIPDSYSLPTASSSTLGGIKVGSNLTISNSALSVKDITVTKSTQGERTAIVSGYSGTLDNSSSSGSGNISSTTYTLVTKTGMPAGTYTLQSLLQSLVNMSHNHVINKGVTSYNCNCNCGDSDE